MAENISSNVSPAYRSDHSLIRVNFIPIVSERGEGFARNVFFIKPSIRQHPLLITTFVFEKEKQPVTIQPDDLAKMEKEATEQEIINIIKSLPNNKTPEDGLPSEFCKENSARYEKSTT